MHALKITLACFELVNSVLDKKIIYQFVWMESRWTIVRRIGLLYSAYLQLQYCVMYHETDVGIDQVGYNYRGIQNLPYKVETMSGV